jgi:hypothetical protein
MKYFIPLQSLLIKTPADISLHLRHSCLFGTLPSRTRWSKQLRTALFLSIVHSWRCCFSEKKMYLIVRGYIIRFTQDMLNYFNKGLDRFVLCSTALIRLQQITQTPAVIIRYTSYSTSSSSSTASVPIKLCGNKITNFINIIFTMQTVK